MGAERGYGQGSQRPPVPFVEGGPEHQYLSLLRDAYQATLQNFHQAYNENPFRLLLSSVARYLRALVLTPHTHTKSRVGSYAQDLRKMLNQSRGRKLTAGEFGKALEALDTEMGRDPFLIAFAPFTILSPGGFLAISHFKHRLSTEDIDFIIDPEWAGDSDIRSALSNAVLKVGEELGYGERWMNDDVSLFVSKEAKAKLFDMAEKQDIVLWEGANLRILAAPFEWCLETKLRRLGTTPNHPKSITDTQDAIVLFKSLVDENGGPLDRDYVADLNTNGFDTMLDPAAIDHVAEFYRMAYNEDLFTN